MSSKHERQTLRDRLAEWRELIEACGRKPTRKRVHALRVITLRIQAEVEHEAGQLPVASHQAQAMLRFEKRASQLRKTLGLVRELDVWIAKLQRLRASLSESSEYVPRSTRETVRQIERLEERLIRRRRTAARKLAGGIEKRLDTLTTSVSDLNEALSDAGHEIEGNEAAEILGQFATISAEFRVLDEGNLHEFRKKIKKVRYLAEIHKGDPSCVWITAQLKRAQTAIGEWHDWHILARTSERGKHASYAELVELLDSLAKEAFEVAAAVCSGVMERMTVMRANHEQPLSNVSKRPVARHEPAVASVRKLA